MRPLKALYGFVALAVVLDLAGADSTLIFGASALAVVPAAADMGEATEELAARTGPGIGGLVNVTFGNAPELIIALFALADGLHEVVKASLVGSIIGNALLVLGASMFAGGWNRTSQRFRGTAARAQAGMLLLTVLALSFPSVLELAHHVALPGANVVRLRVSSEIEGVSIAVAVALILTYGAGLLFSLRTHRDLFNPSEHSDPGEGTWSTAARRSPSRRRPSSWRG